MTSKKKQNDLLGIITIKQNILSVHFRLVKPYLMDSQKGPWEIIWHAFLDRFGEGNYNIFVWGIVICNNSELFMNRIKA